MFHAGVICILYMIYLAIRSNNPAAVREREEERERFIKDANEKFKRETLQWNLDRAAEKRADLVRAGHK